MEVQFLPGYFLWLACQMSAVKWQKITTSAFKLELKILELLSYQKSGFNRYLTLSVLVCFPHLQYVEVTAACLLWCLCGDCSNVTSIQGNRAISRPCPSQGPWALWKWYWCSVIKASGGFYLGFCQAYIFIWDQKLLEIIACLLCKEMQQYTPFI